MRWFLLIAAAGCAKVEEPTFQEPTIEVTQIDEFDTTVIGRGTPGIPAFELHFRGGENTIHMPDRFRVAGSETLATTPNCLNESQIGIAMYPLATAAANFDGGTPTPNGDVTTNFVSIDVNGSHVVRLTVGFSLDYACGTNNERVSGESTFVVYPTGRIVRADRKIRGATGTLQADLMNCSCDGNPQGNGKAFTSYWSFVQSTNANRDSDMLTGSGDSSGACTMLPSGAIGVQYSQPQRVRSDASVSAHVFDFFNEAGELNLPDQEIVSAIQIEPAGATGSNSARCGAILDRLTNATAVFSDSSGDRSYGLNQDGFYGDDFGTRREPFTIRPAGGSALPAGFTVAFDIAGGGNAKITRDPAPTIEPVAYVQRDFPGSTRFFLVFNEGLADGESVTIEPL
jgi:hypothetical protein